MFDRVSMLRMVRTLTPDRSASSSCVHPQARRRLTRKCRSCLTSIVPASGCPDASIMVWLPVVRGWTRCRADRAVVRRERGPPASPAQGGHRLRGAKVTRVAVTRCYGSVLGFGAGVRRFGSGCRGRPVPERRPGAAGSGSGAGPGVIPTGPGHPPGGGAPPSVWCGASRLILSVNGLDAVRSFTVVNTGHYASTGRLLREVCANRIRRRKGISVATNAPWHVRAMVLEGI